MGERPPPPPFLPLLPRLFTTTAVLFPLLPSTAAAQPPSASSPARSHRRLCLAFFLSDPLSPSSLSLFFLSFFFSLPLRLNFSSQRSCRWNPSRPPSSSSAACGFSLSGDRRGMLRLVSVFGPVAFFPPSDRISPVRICTTDTPPLFRHLWPVNSFLAKEDQNNRLKKYLFGLDSLLVILVMKVVGSSICRVV